MSAIADLAVSWARVGLLGFGGGSSMVPLMHSECVDVRAWMSDDEFLDALALGNTLPGPIAAKISIYVGLQVAGWAGAAVAFGAVMGPSWSSWSHSPAHSSGTGICPRCRVRCAP